MNRRSRTCYSAQVSTAPTDTDGRGNNKGNNSVCAVPSYEWLVCLAACLATGRPAFTNNRVYAPTSVLYSWSNHTSTRIKTGGQEIWKDETLSGRAMFPISDGDVVNTA